jgi:hypothetical protein
MPKLYPGIHEQWTNRQRPFCLFSQLTRFDKQQTNTFAQASDLDRTTCAEREEMNAAQLNS